MDPTSESTRLFAENYKIIADRNYNRAKYLTQEGDRCMGKHDDLMVEAEELAKKESDERSRN